MQVFVALFIVLLSISQLGCLCYGAETQTDDRMPCVTMNMKQGILFIDGISNGPDMKVDLREYLSKLKNKLWINWTGDKNSDISTRVIFKVYKDGRIADVKAERPPLTNVIDDTAVQATLKCNPLPPLPEGCPDYLIFQFMFGNHAFMLLEDPTIIGFGKNSSELVNEYFEAVYHKIKRYWYPEKDGGAFPSIMFKLHKDGSITEIEVLNKGSGCHIKSSIKAINDAGPFRPFPYGFEGTYEVVIHFGF